MDHLAQKFKQTENPEQDLIQIGVTDGIGPQLITEKNIGQVASRENYQKFDMMAREEFQNYLISQKISLRNMFSDH